MIPKTIHYCWFGRGEKPKLAEKCIASWKKFCPDFEIIEWNEDNYDVTSTPYTRYCYENKKWAYLSDYVRLDVVHSHGGVYFDTDVEVIASIDDFFNSKAFFAFESAQIINTGLGFGAEKESQFLKAMMEQYAYTSEEDVVIVGCPALNTKALLPFGLKLDGSLQKIDDMLILPAEYMNPYDDPTGRLSITDHTVSIHWYSKSALSKKAILRSKLTRPLHRAFGVDCFKWLKRKNTF